MPGEWDFAVRFARKRKLVVEFEVNDEPFRMRVPRDGRCIPLVMAVELEDIMDFFFETMDRDSFERFEDLVYDMDAGLEMNQLSMLYHHGISLITGGQPYWVIQALVATGDALWVQLSGARPGVDLLALPLHEFCNFVYAQLTEGADKEAREKFDKQLATPPAGVEEEILAQTPEWQNAGQDFLTQMAARGARG